jgi:hypothetical protein
LTGHLDGPRVKTPPHQIQVPGGIPIRNTNLQQPPRRISAMGRSGVRTRTVGLGTCGVQEAVARTSTKLEPFGHFCSFFRIDSSTHQTACHARFPHTTAVFALQPPHALPMRNFSSALMPMVDEIASRHYYNYSHFLLQFAYIRMME